MRTTARHFQQRALRNPLLLFSLSAGLWGQPQPRGGGIGKYSKGGAGCLTEQYNLRGTFNSPHLLLQMGWPGRGWSCQRQPCARSSRHARGGCRGLMLEVCHCGARPSTMLVETACGGCKQTSLGPLQ